MKIGSRRGHLLEKVLNTAINVTIAVASNPGRTSKSAYQTFRDFDELQELSNSQLRRITQYVIDKKYITISRAENGDTEMIVTESGKRAARRLSVLDLKPLSTKRWDKKWRLVMFDIPNDKKQVRDTFAGCLKRLGFAHYQKSVFICPHPCEEQLEVIAEYYGITDYVEIVVAERITHEDSFKASFGF